MLKLYCPICEQEVETKMVQNHELTQFICLDCDYVIKEVR